MSSNCVKKSEAMPSNFVAWMGQQFQISNRSHLARVKTRIWAGNKRRKSGPLYLNLKGHIVKFARLLKP